MGLGHGGGSRSGEVQGKHPPSLPHLIPGDPTKHPLPPPGHLLPPLPLSDSSQLSPPPPFIPSDIFLPPAPRSSGDMGQDTPTRLSGLGCDSPSRDLRHAVSPLRPNPLHHLPRTTIPSPAPLPPCPRVPMSLTRRQGEEAESEDGAVHAVALPPRARPHHSLDPRLQLAQQRLGPAALLGRARCWLHGAQDKSADTGVSETLGKAQIASGGVPGRSQAGLGTPPHPGPRCHGACWALSASGPDPPREAPVDARRWGGDPGGRTNLE